MRKITFILVFISAVICKSLASAYSDSPLTDLLLNTFCREFNLLLKEKGFLENEIITIEDAPLASPDVFSPLFIKKLREGGYPVGLYTLEKKEDVARVPLFMTEWDAKLAVVKKNGEGYLIFQDESSISLDNSDEFFKKWSTNYIIAPFSTGIWQAIKNDTDKNNLIFIIYAYHNMPVDILLKEVEKIISDSQGKKIVYIDELGLIPEDTIKRCMETQKVDEGKAFAQTKQILTEETARIEQGFPVYDTNPLYSALYKLLAKNRIKCILEDLAYANWKNIVAFDLKQFDTLAFTSFVNGDMNNYMLFKKIYCFGFWKYNVQDREDNFASQIASIVQTQKDTIVFTLRGIGHFGLEEKLAKKGVDAKFIILGEGLLEDNLINQQIVQVYSTLGVSIPNPLFHKLFLAAEIQESIREYLVKTEKQDTLSVTLKTNTILRKLKSEDIAEVLDNVKRESSEKRFTDLASISEFVYKLVDNIVTRK